MSEELKKSKIVLGELIFSEIDKKISELNPSAVFVLIDDNVNRLCFPIVLEKCKSIEGAVVIEIPPGEDQKNLTTSAKIISLLLDNNADRNCLLINQGGGVVCDLGGFVASVYKRGIRFINIPTTLLSMVDASIGGKTGINFLGNKNVIGTFARPVGIFVNPGFLSTLEEKEKRSGFAEIIKHILLSDEKKWKNILRNPNWNHPDSYEELIRHSIDFKESVTENDFRENGKRKILNFGHTIGHALESHSHLTDYPLRHGDAIAAGMIAELYMSFKKTGFPEDEMLAAVYFIHNIFNDLVISVGPEDLVSFLYADKKNSNDKIGFSLLENIGKSADVVFTEIETIVESLIFMNEVFSRSIVQ